VPRNELELISWIRSRVAHDPNVVVGIGDDTAVLKTQETLLVTVDMLLEGVHFDLAGCTARDVGQKALNVNLSDIAAMAGRPTVAVVAVGMPNGRPETLADDLFAGLLDAAKPFSVTLAGGDTNSSKLGLVVAVTLLGHPTGSGPVRRSGAKPRDVLCVTGRLGYSLAGRHLHFTPRVTEAQRLHENYRLNAMIDLSDGLGQDLFHLTDASGCGALLDAGAIPIQPSPPGWNDDRPPLDHALYDGEDFELLFAMPEPEAQRLLRDQPLRDLGVAITRIGIITGESAVLLRDDHSTRPLLRTGYTHSW
jgi:thiamine-monophosphate kinase